MNVEMNKEKTNNLEFCFQNDAYKSFLVPLTVEFSAESNSDGSVVTDGILSASTNFDSGIAYILQFKVKTKAITAVQHNLNSIFFKFNFRTFL